MPASDPPLVGCVVSTARRAAVMMLCLLLAAPRAFAEAPTVQQPHPPAAATPSGIVPPAPNSSAQGSAKQVTPPAQAAKPAAPAPPAAPVATSPLSLSAVYGNEDQAVQAGLQWRVFNERAEDDGSHTMVAQSTEAAPTVALPDGEYIVHAAFGLAGETKHVVMAGHAEIAKLKLNAGGLKINGIIGTASIPASRLSISVFVPERGNSEAKLVVDNAAAGEVLLLPEGSYHVVSTYLDTVGIGAVQSATQPGHLANASNSVVATDIRVQTGKLMDVTLRHRAAVQTLKLVNGPNGEAFTDTQFTVLTPGGDVIRELIGAFPSLVLAEGDYIAIARHGMKTYQANFSVQSGLDRDVEIIAK